MSIGIVEMSFMGSGMIVCTLLIKALYRSSLPAWVTGFMWAAVLSRLLVPFSISSPLSIQGVFLGTSKTQAVSWQPVVSQPALSLQDVAILGTMLCAAAFAFTYIKQRRVLDAALPVVITPELFSMIADHKLARPVGIYTSDRISTPMAAGIVKPRIILPSHMALEGETLRYVVAHECCHIKHGDAFKRLLLMLALCLHWFNPLVWLMAAAVRRDMELACDRRVLDMLGNDTRVSYARTLLQLESNKPFSGIAYNHFSASPMEERIRSIMSAKRAAMPGIISAVMVFAIMAVPLFTSPQAQHIIAISTFYSPYTITVHTGESATEYPSRITITGISYSKQLALPSIPLFLDEGVLVDTALMYPIQDQAVPSVSFHAVIADQTTP